MSIRRSAAATAVAVVVATLLSACSVRVAAPGCAPGTRLALVAQSVPSAAYVPCENPLPAGWHTVAFTASSGESRFSLTSDRTPGRAVTVILRDRCDTTGATPTTARAEGVRTSLRLRSVDPRYAGTMFDVFPGGCVSYEFDFAKGPHIASMEDLNRAIGLFSRRDLKVALQRRLGLRLDP